MNDNNTAMPDLQNQNTPEESSLQGASGGVSTDAQQKTTTIPIPPEAEDNDLIEKEWVERAKQIVEHTRHNPHEQQKALSLMKADYMKKRYNRDIKVSERDLKDQKTDTED